MAGRLIITNGDAAVTHLQESGIAADFLPWRDVLHDGPVPGGLLLEALSLVRAQFLAAEFGQRLGNVARQFAERDALARSHGQYERVELWFEHDLYDQLQLIEILDFFAEEKRTQGLWLVQLRDVLGSLPRIAVRVAGERATAVTPEQRALARRAWTAFTAPTPERIAALAAAPTPALPHLAAALARFLQELPAIASGLGLSEQRALTLLAEGPQLVSELFAATQAQEQARFMGDMSFYRILDRLAYVPHPLIAGLAFPSTHCGSGTGGADYSAYAATEISITKQGRASLAGRFDHAVENGIDRWFGGTHVTAKTLWRRDARGLASPA